MTDINGIVSHSLKDSPNLTIVSVIASFDTERHIRPLYIRIGDESLKVYKATVINTYYNQTTFQCEVIDGDFVKQVRLTYFANESLWAIPVH